MNVPNKLTVSRFAITLFFLAVIFFRVPDMASIKGLVSHVALLGAACGFLLDYKATIALVLFSAAGVTDYLDGEIARRNKLITNFGILMDPLADKILVCSAFIAFVGLNWVPAWMAVLVVARELTITGLRLLAASKNLVLAAEGFGKHKTGSQIVAVLSVLVFHSDKEPGPVRMIFHGLPTGWLGLFTALCLWFAVIMTVSSGAYYLWRNRGLYLAEV
jgi:CDP-diacylglycerol--glycerol-3-phosphate 3-phosphatidyltransferase